MKLLDLFCGAGGCAKGYQLAGFTEIVGIDAKAQPRYPYTFVKGDALEYCAEHGHEFDAIHASPPCQAHSAMRTRWKDRQHVDLVGATRERLVAAGKPYVIENVVGAPLVNPVLLCGTMFGLGLPNGAQLRRHRLFECSFALLVPFECRHNSGSALGVYGGGQHPGRRYHKQPATIGVWGKPGGSSTRDEITQYGLEDRKLAMGVDWMRWDELSQAIPPAYTEFIGRQLLEEARR